MTVIEALRKAFTDGMDRGAVAVLEAPDLLDRIGTDHDEEEQR